MSSVIYRFVNPLIGTLALAALPAAIAAAQENQDARRSTQHKAYLEEVIVTATKREASMQDVPIAVSAVSGSMLEDNQIVNSADLSKLVASLNVQSAGNPRSSSFNIRGIGTQSFSSGVEPSVSTMVDGVVLGRSAMAFAQLPDVKRVEVLRGPQGTLFGKNSSGGVIHIITKDPSPEFEGAINLMAVEDDEYRLSGTLAGPISEDLNYRLTASYIDNDGYIENIYDGQDYNTVEDKMVRAKLGWEINDHIDVKYTYDWAENDCDCVVQPIREAGEPSATALLPVVPSDENDQLNTTTSQIPTTETETSGHTLDVNWDIKQFTLTSISAYREWEIDRSAGIGNLPTDPLALVQTGNSDQDQFTQEIRLTSPADQFASYVAGLYYFDQSVDRHFDRDLTIPNTSIHIVQATDFTIDTNNYAAFGEVVFNVADSVRLITGARYTNDELEYDYRPTAT